MMKDEQETILRTLISAADFVDQFVVLDTGSTDKSIEIVKNFCKGRKTPLKLETMKWVDFSTNRNHLLSMCEGVAHFTLLLDSNDEAKNGEPLITLLNQIKDDEKQVLFGTRFCWDNDNGIPGNSRQYYKPAVIRNNGTLRYKYPIHETLTIIKSGQFVYNRSLETSDFHIYQDRAKDGSSVDRIRNYDIKVILDYMEREGESSRMLRYLCQSYDVVKDFENLYKWTEKLVVSEPETDRYNEDIYIGHIWRGRSAAMLDIPNFHIHYLKAFQYFKKTGYENAEPLHELGTIYNKKNNHQLAFMWARKACAVKCPPENIKDAVVNYKLHHEVRWLLLYVSASKVEGSEEDAQKALEQFGKLDLCVINSPNFSTPVMIKVNEVKGYTMEAGRAYQLSELPIQLQTIIKQNLGISSNTLKVDEVPAHQFRENTRGKKLYVLVRYRDREQQLNPFIESVTAYLQKADIDFEIWILEQTDRGPFSRGIPYNVAVKLFEKCNAIENTYVCLHDIDVVPLKGANYFYPDPNHINHLHGNTFALNMATVMRTEDFVRINGMSNLYENWGFEDNDFQRRAVYNKLFINRNFFSPRYSTHTFKEINPDHGSMKAKMTADTTKVNFNIFRNNYDPQDDGYKQLKVWEPFVEWVPWTKHYSHFKIDIAGIKEANNLTECMGDNIPDATDYPEGVLQGKPIELVKRKWSDPVL